jgi:hypothetical protein
MRRESRGAKARQLMQTIFVINFLLFVFLLPQTQIPATNLYEIPFMDHIETIFYCGHLEHEIMPLNGSQAVEKKIKRWR